MGLICFLISLYVLVLLARMVLSWFPIGAGSPLAPVEQAVRAVTDPVLEPLGRVIPPVRLGSVAFDLTPLIVLVGLQVLAGIIC